MRIPVLHTAAGKRPFLILIFSSLTEEETELTTRPQQTSQSQQLQRQSNFSSGVRDLWVDKHEHVLCPWGANHLKFEQKRKPQATTPATWEARDTLAEGVNK